MILLKKKNRMEGGREGRREGVWWKIWDSRIYKFYFLSCFFVFSFSSFLFYLYFFAIIFLFFFKMFLYHCNSLAPVLPICICLFGLCGRNLSSSHLSLKKKKKEKKIIITECTEYCILGTWSSYLRFTSCACSRESFLLEDNPVSCFPPLLVKDNAV